MARTFKRGLIGREDLSLGVTNFSRSTSTGGSQTITQIPDFDATASNNTTAVRTSKGALAFNYWLMKTRTITSSDFLSVTDSVILCDCTSGAITLSLAAAATNSGRLIFIKKIDSSGNAMTIDPNGAELIDGAATKATSTQYVSFTIVSDGTAWYIF